MIVDTVLDMVGNTPSVRLADALGTDRIHMKLEGANPTGSVKDRACVAMLNDVVARGAFEPGMRLLDASSGNMACAIAFFGRLLDMPVTIVSSSKLTAEKHGFLRYMGADVELVGNFTIDGNRHCHALVERNPDRYCFLDQLHNWKNPEAHYATTGPELLREFPSLGAVVGSLGSGGTMAGVAKFLREHSPATRVITVEAASGTKIPGTGSFLDGDYVTPFMRGAFDEGLFNDQVAVTEADAYRWTQWLTGRGVFGGVQTGGLLAALEQRGVTDIDGPIVAISGDSGWKNLEKLIALQHA